MSSPLKTLGAALALLLPATAQTNLVQINEVNFTTAGVPDQWIEIANFGANAVEMTNWSIYQATLTAGMPQNYWWPFPEGTRIPAGEVIRVRWLNPIDTGNTNPRIIDTGDTVFHFLFGLRGEPLSREVGGLCLVASQNNLDMNTASVYRDWLSWGTTPGTLPREDLAVQNGRWVAGARIPQAALDQSLALNSALLTEPTPTSAFFHDNTPTPGSHNHSGDQVTIYGTNCILGVGQAPTLSVVSIPVPGNEDFAIVTDGLEAATSVLGLFLGTPAPQGLPWVQPPCQLWIDYTLPIIGLGIVPSDTSFAFKPELRGVPGITIALQSIVVRSSSVGFTNGVTLRVSLF